MKTTSIYTLFFSPTGTSRKIAAAVVQGMTETEGTATEESAGHNADAAQAPSSGQVPGAGPAAAAAPEPAAGNGGETKSMHGEPTVTAIDLTQVEFQIMELFFHNPGIALVREKILKGVWGENYFGDVKIVDVNIRRLRMKVEDEPSHPTHIMTVWGYGYRWEE